MPDVIISDASCLINLDKIEHLYLLNEVYETVIITPEIKEEYGKEVPSWITERIPKDKKLQRVLNQTLDKGEASAIALALEISEALLILDDLKARRMAKSLMLKMTGTLGVLVKAKKIGVIQEIKPILDLLQKTNFRLSQKLVNQILHVTNENTN